MDPPYYKNQIITYMGNKRKILPYIKEVIDEIEKKEGRKLSMGDGFSGSGIVSRLFKSCSAELYCNDISDYSYSLNKCFLSNISKTDKKEIETYIEEANNLVTNKEKNENKESFISGNWAPSREIITKKDRVYFTFQNGKRIDLYRDYIEKIPENIKHFLLGPLLVECSVHNNTSGQFAAFYKNGEIGQYGGKRNIDIQRIQKPIELPFPVHLNNTCNVNINQMDTNEWAKKIPYLDLVYYDPPYNKHSYSTYYFLLNIIALWNKNIKIPETTRGQPLDWERSAYNSFKEAENEFSELIKNTKSKYIIISYNSTGIISLEKMQLILEKYGTVEIIPIDHKAYNRMKGIADYKRKGEKKTVREYLWVLEKK